MEPMTFDRLFTYTVKQPHMLRVKPNETVDATTWSRFDDYLNDLINGDFFNDVLTEGILAIVFDWQRPEFGAVVMPMNRIAFDDTEIAQIETALLGVMQGCFELDETGFNSGDEGGDDDE